MFTATFIAKKGALEPALVTSVQSAWGGGDAVWLAPDEAAEFEVARIPDNRWEVWSDLQDLGVDLVVQPSGFFASMDTDITEISAETGFHAFSGLTIHGASATFRL